MSECRCNQENEEGRNMKIRNKKTIGCIGIFIVILGVVIGIFNTPTQKIKRQLTLGYRYLENQQYEEAIIAFENVISIDEKCIQAYAGLVKVYKNTGSINELEKTILDAVLIIEGFEEEQYSLNKNYIDLIYKNKNEIKEREDLEKGELQAENTREKHIEATQEDFDILLQQAEGLVDIAEYGGYDKDALTVNDFGFFISVFVCFYDDKDANIFLPIKITGMQTMNEVDPRGYGPWANCYCAPVNEMDWILENVFQVSENIYKAVEMQDIDSFYYRGDDNYYLSIDGLGLSGVEDTWINNMQMNEKGNYDINLGVSGILWVNEEIVEEANIHLEASLNVHENKKYWCFEKIAPIQNSDAAMPANVRVEDMSSITEQLNELELSTANSMYINLKSDKTDLVGVIEERFYEADPNVGGYDRVYYTIVLEYPVEISFEDVDGYIYTETYDEIQIDSSVAEYANQKVACRVKGWNSLVGALSEWVVPGAVFGVE